MIGFNYGYGMYILNPYIYGTAGTSYLLDTYSAAAAYSLRQLKTGVTNVVRVRRSSDNAESDFSATDITDGTLATWSSGTDSFVVTWYDQSGNGNDATQSTAASQSILVSSGSVLTHNGTPCVNTALGGAKIGYDITSVSVVTMASVAKLEAYNTVNYIAGGSGVGYYYGGTFSGLNGLGGYDGTNVADINSGEDLNEHLGFFNHRSSKLFVSRDGSETDCGTFASSLTITDVFSYGSSASSNSSEALMKEIILFTTDESSNRTAIESDINTYYSIY